MLARVNHGQRVEPQIVQGGTHRGRHGWRGGAFHFKTEAAAPPDRERRAIIGERQHEISVE
jgi:hypothetical protein